MIQVLKINKHGNRISSYTCTDGSKTLDLTKEQLINFIDRKMVNNAKKQVYQGKTIIRVDDAAKFISNQVQNNNKEDSNNTKYEENQLIQYVNKAKEKGIKELDLGQIAVDTSTFEIRKIDRLSEGEIETNAILNFLTYTYNKEEAFKLYSKYMNRNTQHTSNIKPDSEIVINKDTPWIKGYIKLADRIYQEITANKDINNLLNTKHIETYLYVETDDGEEYFIHTNDKNVKHHIKDLKEENVYVTKSGEIDIFIGLAYRDPNKKYSEKEKHTGFFLYLDYNILTNQFSLSSNNDYELMITPNEEGEPIWLSASEVVNFLKFNLSKLR